MKTNYTYTTTEAITEMINEGVYFISFTVHRDDTMYLTNALRRLGNNVNIVFYSGKQEDLAGEKIAPVRGGPEFIVVCGTRSALDALGGIGKEQVDAHSKRIKFTVTTEDKPSDK